MKKQISVLFILLSLFATIVFYQTHKKDLSKYQDLAETPINSNDFKPNFDKNVLKIQNNKIEMSSSPLLAISCFGIDQSNGNGTSFFNL
jgi:hypothetical protein